MKLIAKITDETIGEKSVPMNNVTHRKGARGIVIKNNGEIAVFYKRKKNQYKLPGGGLEQGETFEEAFIREVKEEVGCVVEIVECLGTIEEYKSKDNFIQTSYVFVRKSNKRRTLLIINTNGTRRGWRSFMDDSQRSIRKNKRKLSKYNIVKIFYNLFK